MSFASQGPPASTKQIAYLEALLRKAGFGDFRDARLEFQLTSRQVRGKFTKQEASALIDKLTAAEDEDTGFASVTEEPETVASAQSFIVRGFPPEVLAEELQRRGWTVRPPASKT